jgi:hypothetical protein
VSITIKGKRSCSKCKGTGRYAVTVFDPEIGRDDEKIKICACVGDILMDGTDIPARLDGFTFDDVVGWWADRVRERNGPRFTAVERVVTPTDTAIGNLRKAVAAMAAWADRTDPNPVDFWWIHGDPSSGRSTLAATAMAVWCQAHGKSGAYRSMRELGKELLNSFAGVYNFDAPKVMLERDLVDPLANAPILILDDWDRMENDVRVATSMSQLLDARYTAGLPTIIVAADTPKNLWERGPSYPLKKIADASAQARLERAKVINLRLP